MADEKKPSDEIIAPPQVVKAPRKKPVYPETAQEAVLGRFGELTHDQVVAHDFRPPQGSHRIKAVLYLAALGLSRKTIASQIGISVARVGDIIRGKSAQAEIDRIQHEMFLADPQKMFMKILPSAVRTATKVMTNKMEKGSVKADVAFRFMDRALGKPKQEIEHSGSMVRELFDRLDKMEKNKGLIETTGTVLDGEIVSEEERPVGLEGPVKDEIDQLVDEIL